LTDRDFEAVKKDVKILAESNLIELYKSNKGRKNNKPVCNLKKITIPI